MELNASNCGRPPEFNCTSCPDAKICRTMENLSNSQRAMSKEEIEKYLERQYTINK